MAELEQQQVAQEELEKSTHHEISSYNNLLPVTSSNTKPLPSKSAVTVLAGDASRYPAVRVAAAKMGWRLVTPSSSKASSYSSLSFSSSSSSSSSKTKTSTPSKSKSRQPQSSNCNVLWVDISIVQEFFFLIQPWQCINHFPGMCNIARKTRLAQNLEAMRKKFPGEYNFYPQTFALPKDFTSFRSHFTSDSGRRSKHTWIIKPDGGAKGKGIFLTRDMAEIQYAVQSNGCSYVAQRYIARPSLIDGKKFDLRLYVLVTSCDPLRMYLFRDGLCRLCTMDFVKPSAKNLKDRCAHLTNYSINKRSAAFERDEDCTVDDDTGNIRSGGDSGSKRSVSWLLSWLRSKHGDDVVDRLWCRIGDICVKTVLSILPTLVSEYRATFGTGVTPAENGAGGGAGSAAEPSQRHGEPNDGGVEGSRCFEILGFDVMLDDKLRPHLIEVNHLPSFGTDAPIDKAIKSKVIEQAMGVVRANASDRRVYEQSQREKSRHRLVNRRSSSLLREKDPCEIDDEKDSTKALLIESSAVDATHRHALPPTAESILTEIYTEHAPEKLDRIPSMLIKYRGYEEWLVAKARERYCNPCVTLADDCDDEGLVNGQHEADGNDTDDDEEHDFSSDDKDCEAEDIILKDYDRIYPLPQRERPLSPPPYEEMKDHAFGESVKQAERLTVPLYQSRTAEDDQNGGDTANRLEDLAPTFNSKPSRADSWISGSLHRRRASLPAKIRRPPTKKQLQNFDRLSRGQHAKENTDASGEAAAGIDLDPFNTSLERARREVSTTLIAKKRWDLVKRVRAELDEVKERRQRNQDRLDRGRITLACQSLSCDFDLVGSNSSMSSRNGGRI